VPGRSAAPAARASAPEPPAPEQDRRAEPVRRPAEVPVGGRAAARLERQAAEAARKKAGRRSAPPARPEEPARQHGSAEADPPIRRAPRRIVQGLVAVVVVAVAVLGFWSFASPGTQETAAQTPATSAPPPSSAAPSAPVPPSAAPSAEVTPAPVGPVRAPVTVLNSTAINGLAADVGGQFTDGGWQVTQTGKSPVEDVATTTVYYTEGDAVQQQAATQLVEQFPDVSGPAPRYFDVPGGDPSALVVVVTGNWRP
jgi:hypothetical protein